MAYGVGQPNIGRKMAKDVKSAAARGSKPAAKPALPGAGDSNAARKIAKSAVAAANSAKAKNTTRMDSLAATTKRGRETIKNNKKTK